METSSKHLNYWPAMLDLVTATLMVFLMVTFLQTLLSAEELETLVVRSRQESFLQTFNQEFSSEIDHGVVAIERELNFLQITFSDRVLFASGDYRLQPQGRNLLDRTAMLLAKTGSADFQQVQVDGHTDDLALQRTTYPSNNWQLSAARAISVIELLADRTNLLPNLLSANGYASHRPVASNETPEGRARNRRIEIRLFFSGHDAGSLADATEADAGAEQ